MYIKYSIIPMACLQKMTFQLANMHINTKEKKHIIYQLTRRCYELFFGY